MGSKRHTIPNESDSADVADAVALNTTTAVKVLDANPRRLFCAITNGSDVDVWIRLYAQATDNDKKGFILAAGMTWEMPTDAIYTGEISAIAASGTGKNVYSTEY